MKKLIIAALLALTLTGSACESRTSYGECRGLFDSEEKSPNLVYQTSTLNVVLGVVFFETIFAPLIAFGWDLYCPVDKKN